MSCYICGRGNCCVSFHSLDEQKAFERAEEAYEKFLEIRNQCREEYNAIEEETEEQDEEGGES